MKCCERECARKAEFAKAGSEEAFCAIHAPIGMDALHNLGELPVNGWDHVDGMKRCETCLHFEAEDAVEACESCEENTCPACVRGSRCRGCLEASELEADADYSWRHR